jgi:hypothetical protein
VSDDEFRGLTWGKGLPPDDPIFSKGLITVFSNVPAKQPEREEVPEDTDIDVDELEQG